MWGKIIFVLFNLAVYNVVFAAAKNVCDVKKAKGTPPELPTLADQYSATYEYTYSSEFTLIMQEEYDGKNGKFSLVEYLNGVSNYLYETGGSSSQIFEIKNGTCKEISRSDLNKIEFLKKLRAISPGLVKDKNIYLKLLVELPKANMIGYVGKKRLPVNNILVNQWVYCFDNSSAINVYWSDPAALTHSANPYPVQVSIDYFDGMQENVYIFKYLGNQVNESALDPPEDIFCSQRYSNKQLNTTKFIGNDMTFTTEVVDPIRKTITTSKHIYALDESIVQITTLDPTPKKGEPLREVEFLFDINLGYYFEINQYIDSCIPRPIELYIENLGDLFQIQKGMFSDATVFGHETSYFFDKYAWSRGIRTHLYKGYRGGYPRGIDNANSIINWYILEKNEYGDTVPIALEFYISKEDQVNGKTKQKVSFDLFDWNKVPDYDPIDFNQFYMYFCVKQGVWSSFQMTFIPPTVAQGESISDEIVLRKAQHELAKIAKISILRFQNFEVNYSSERTRAVFTFQISPEFKDVPSSNVTIGQAAKLIKGAVNKKFQIPVRMESGKVKKFLAIKDSFLEMRK